VKVQIASCHEEVARFTAQSRTLAFSVDVATIVANAVFGMLLLARPTPMASAVCGAGLLLIGFVHVAFVVERRSLCGRRCWRHSETKDDCSSTEVDVEPATLVDVVPGGGGIEPCGVVSDLDAGGEAMMQAAALASEEAARFIHLAEARADRMDLARRLEDLQHEHRALLLQERQAWKSARRPLLGRSFRIAVRSALARRRSWALARDLLEERPPADTGQSSPADEAAEERPAADEPEPELSEPQSRNACHASPKTAARRQLDAAVPGGGSSGSDEASAASAPAAQKPRRTWGSDDMSAACQEVGSGEAASAEISKAAGPSPVQSPSKDMVSKLARLAEGSPDLQKKIRERLQASAAAKELPVVAAAAEGATPPLVLEPEATTQLSTATSTADHSQADEAQDGRPSPIRNEILSRLEKLAAAHADLQARWEVQGKALQAAESTSAALLAEVKQRERELGTERERIASLRAECDGLRRLGICREAFRPAAPKEAELSLHWAEAWDWPGGTASIVGMRQLRRSMEGRSAELTVGPPPAGWRSWLQLGLRRGQPTEPSLLRLKVPGAGSAGGNAPGAEDGCDTYMGLLWPAPAL